MNFSKSGLGSYIKFKIELDPVYHIYNLIELKNVGTKDNIINDFIKSDDIRGYNFNGNFSLDGECAYSIEYNTRYGGLALLSFLLQLQMHNTIGWVESSINTRDCMLFRSDVDGMFEVFIFKNQLLRENELLKMLIAGDIDEDIPGLN